MSVFDLFRFNKMLSAALIQLVYWLGLLGFLLAVLHIFGISHDLTAPVAMFFLGIIGPVQNLLMMVGITFSGMGAPGPYIDFAIAVALVLLLWRLICESLILLFAIHSKLVTIVRQTKAKA
jgi:hypothetical protein